MYSIKAGDLNGFWMIGLFLDHKLTIKDILIVAYMQAWSAVLMFLIAITGPYNVFSG